MRLLVQPLERRFVGATMGRVDLGGLRTDDQLLRLAQAGDAHAFGVLVRRHDPAMRRLASSMVRRRSSVDDILQDSYLKAFRAIGTFRGEAAFPTWLYRIVYRVCLDDQRRARPVESLDESTEQPSREHFDSADQLVLGDAIRRALQSLSPDHRAIVAMVDGEGYSYDETASILELNPGTVASRLARARAALRTAYESSTTEGGG